MTSKVVFLRLFALKVQNILNFGSYVDQLLAVL